jgi:hypothetical protein
MLLMKTACSKNTISRKYFLSLLADGFKQTGVCFSAFAFFDNSLRRVQIASRVFDYFFITDSLSAGVPWRVGEICRQADLHAVSRRYSDKSG